MSIEGLGAVQSGKNLTLKAVMQSAANRWNTSNCTCLSRASGSSSKKISDNEFSVGKPSLTGDRVSMRTCSSPPPPPEGKKPREEKVVVG